MLPLLAAGRRPTRLLQAFLVPRLPFSEYSVAAWPSLSLSRLSGRPDWRAQHTCVRAVICARFRACFKFENFTTFDLFPGSGVRWFSTSQPFSLHCQPREGAAAMPLRMDVKVSACSWPLQPTLFGLLVHNNEIPKSECMVGGN